MPFVKTDPNPPVCFFKTEAAGLAWLAASKTVPVVGVRKVAHKRIELEQLQPVPATRDGAISFGRQLAALHESGADAFGCAPPDARHGYIAQLKMPYGDFASWGEMYAKARLKPLLRQARLDGDGKEALTALSEKLIAGEFDDDAPPARIHGDLWAGNVFSAASGWTLIDPAAHGGHAITDLAMLQLFGNPHLEATFAAYEEASTTLRSDWRDLIKLHQVWPLLVHAVIFGGQYARQATLAAKLYV